VIVELAIAAGVASVASALAARAWMSRRRPAAPSPAPPPATAARGPGLYPGDVLSMSGEEAVLEQGSELDDGGFVLRIFELISVRPRFLVQLDLAGEALVIAEPTGAVPEGRVADAVELEGRTLGLVRRGKANARAVVAGSPTPWSGELAYVVLGDRGGRRLVVLDAPGQPRLALSGDLLDRRMVDLLPGR
jgi:hypothetical protein